MTRCQPAGDEEPCGADDCSRCESGRLERENNRLRHRIEALREALERVVAHEWTGTMAQAIAMDALEADGAEATK